MEYFAHQGYDTWCVDMEGIGRSTKDRDNNAPISFGADDCFAAATYIQNSAAATVRSWSTASRRARYAPRCSPNAIPSWSIASRSTPWCGPAKAHRRSPSARRTPSFSRSTGGR